MGENTTLLHCYNKGCGKTFQPDDNPDDICVYHSGEPYFHDAYKEWTCCKRKSTDFTEFLNIKGCTKGKHSSERPPLLDQPRTKDNLLETVENIFSKCATINHQKKEIVRDTDPNQPAVHLVPNISPRLVQQLSEASNETEVQIVDGEVPIGTICKNSGCKMSFDKGISDTCQHHPGSAIFHEGLKYWSCCRKITSDFSKFLEQAGCTVGNHVWFKEQEEVQCRVDWHQTGTTVVVSVFAKNYDPYKSTVSLSPTRLLISILFPKESQVFERKYNLFGIVNVAESSVSMLPTKIEIKLAKSVGEQWGNLFA